MILTIYRMQLIFSVPRRSHEHIGDWFDRREMICRLLKDAARATQARDYSSVNIVEKTEPYTIFIVDNTDRDALAALETTSLCILKRHGATVMESLK